MFPYIAGYILILLKDEKKRNYMIKCGIKYENGSLAAITAV
jgi:hypothetical protein